MRLLRHQRITLCCSAKLYQSDTGFVLGAVAVRPRMYHSAALRSGNANRLNPAELPKGGAPMRRLFLAIMAIQLATASVSTATMLAVGSELGSPLPSGGKESWPLILRYSDGGQWQHIELPRDVRGLLHGVTFSTPTNAWAYGLNASQQLLLLRSEDAGITWTDVSTRLPTEGLFGPVNLRIDALRFSADANAAWLVAHGTAMVGPFIASSIDGGLTWSPFSSSDVSPGSRSSIVTLPTGTKLLRRDAESVRVQTLSDARQERTALSSVSDSFNLSAAVATGGKLFLAGFEGDGKEVESPVPAIYLRNADDPPTRLQINVSQPGFLDSIHVGPNGSGVASGRYGIDGTQALLLYTNDGHTWQPSELRNVPAGVTIRAVMMTTESDAWGVGYIRSEHPTQVAVLHSVDGGETWERVSAPPVSTSHLYAIAGDS